VVKAAVINALLIGSGGFAGALLRSGLSGFVYRQVPLSTFPYGTLVVNLVGCFFIGGFTGLVEARQLFGPELRTFVLIGLLGGFTTFSTFGFESFALLRDGEVERGLAYIALHLILGLTLVWVGYSLATSNRVG